MLFKKYVSYSEITKQVASNNIYRHNQPISKSNIQTTTSSSSSITNNGNPISNYRFNPDQVLVLHGATDKEKCNNRSTFLLEFSKLFPRSKLATSSLKPNGLMFLSFVSNHDAKLVSDNWKPTYFGEKTSVNFLHRTVPFLYACQKVFN